MTLDPAAIADFFARVPGRLGAPWLGQTLGFYRDYLGLVRRQHAAFGPVFKHRVIGLDSVALLGPAANRFLLADGAASLSSRLGWDWSLGRLFPRGLMLRDGDDHRHHRRILQVAFSRDALAGYLEPMQPRVAGLAREWPAGRVAAHPRLKTFLLDLAARVFCGLTLREEIAALNAHFAAVVRASTALLRRSVPGFAYARGLHSRGELARFFAELVAARRGAPGEDLLGRLCAAVSEEGDTLADDEVVDHMVFFLMAAHDTTTSTLSSLLRELALAPAWQERLRQESRAFATGGAISLERLRELTLLGQAIKETLRLHPPLVLIPRRTTAEVEFDGWRIPAGVNVGISTAFTHRMPELWTDPETFDPDRFSDARAEDRRLPFTWIPFGGGAHLCLGMFFAEIQVKLVAHHLLSSLRWRAIRGWTAPIRQVPIQFPTDDLPLDFERL
ncbi:MAG: cytochrome P450 [Vicinamibacteria bacterium]|nr:cytochrome P450 [Vicinamibacteria bacterium]